MNLQQRVAIILFMWFLAGFIIASSSFGVFVFSCMTIAAGIYFILSDADSEKGMKHDR